MSVIHMNEASFHKAIADAPLALVDFWAPWCGPCKMLAPAIEELAASYDGKALVAKVDIDESSALAAQYGVMSIPTVLIFKDGKEVDRKVGLMPAATYAAALDANL